MATLNVLNSTLMAWYSGGTPTKIAHTNSAKISYKHDVRNIDTKDTAGWQEFLEGMRGCTGEVSGLIAFDDTNGGTALLSSLTGRTTIDLVFKTGVTGDKTFTGEAYVTSWEIDSPDQESNVTYSASFTFTGPVVMATAP
jgi:predicted secreted protein